MHSILISSIFQVCRTCGEYIAPEEQRLSLPLKLSMITSDPKQGTASPEKTMVQVFSKASTTALIWSLGDLGA